MAALAEQGPGAYNAARQQLQKAGPQVGERGWGPGPSTGAGLREGSQSGHVWRCRRPRVCSGDFSKEGRNGTTASDGD